MVPAVVPSRIIHYRFLILRSLSTLIRHLLTKCDKDKGTASCGSRVESTSAHCAGGLPIKSRQPTSVTNMAYRERDWPPCCIHAYTVYTPIGGKGRCHTRCDLQDHSMQARKSAGKISTLDSKPTRKDTRSPKQEQSVAPQNGPWSRQKI